MSDAFQELRDNHHNFDKGKMITYSKNTPWDLFQEWYQEAFSNNIKEPNAFSLSTVASNGAPSSRILYLKEFLDNKFIFYTNYESQKGRQIEGNPRVSLLFFWPELERQIRIEGWAKKVDFEVSEAYFKSRPRASQIGAWASRQSELLENSQDLLDRIALLEAKYPDDVPCPKDWGGYCVDANLIEFWQGRPSRLHDRLVFSKEESNWSVFRKNP
ncbi:MAG: pyridoxamine 5'-phosphate oxidase [Bacteroidetes bacterium]|nr:pyridoxamine 5'-phosphate oxidase [Bacteroidota bacterium]